MFRGDWSESLPNARVKVKRRFQMLLSRCSEVARMHELQRELLHATQRRSTDAAAAAAAQQNFTEVPSVCIPSPLLFVAPRPARLPLQQRRPPAPCSEGGVHAGECSAPVL